MSFDPEYYDAGGPARLQALRRGMAHMIQFGPATYTVSGTRGTYNGSAPLKGNVTSTFGAAEPFRVDPPPDGYGLGPHGGCDIDDNLEANAPILAPAPGEAVEVGYNDDVGWFARINHGEGVVSKYLHMLGAPNDGALPLLVGDWVERGEQIGSVGTTGRWSSGPHLHWSCRVNGVLVDPLSLVVAALTVPDLTELPRPREPLPIPQVGDPTPEFSPAQWDKVGQVLSIQAHSGLFKGIDIEYPDVTKRNRYPVVLGIAPSVVED